MDFLKLVRNTLEKENKSISKFAGEMGVSKQYLTEVLRGAKPASALLKAKIARHFELEMTVNILLELLPEDALVVAKELVIEQMIRNSGLGGIGSKDKLEELTNSEKVLQYYDYKA